MPQGGKNLHSPRTGRGPGDSVRGIDREKSGNPGWDSKTPSQVLCRWTVRPATSPPIDPAAPDSLGTFVSLVPKGKVLYNHFQVVSKSFQTKPTSRMDVTTGFCNGNADLILIMRENVSQMEMW